MPRLNPAWVVHRLLSGHPRDALSRMRRAVDVDVEGESVTTRYLSLGELAAAFSPWFTLERSELQLRKLRFLEVGPASSSWSGPGEPQAPTVSRHIFLLLGPLGDCDMPGLPTMPPAAGVGASFHK